MKLPKLSLTLVSLMAITTISAQDISLPAPQKSGGMALSDALASRRSIREFDASREIPKQMLSDLLWSAAGINRADGYRTNPTALNTQEIDLYVFTHDGVYLYDFAENSLKKAADGDHRNLVAGTEAFSQEFVLDAPVSIVMVADIGKFERVSDKNIQMAATDTGIVSQNINLYCSANGLATVPRLTMDFDGISKLLRLSPGQRPMLNNPVGYPK